MDLEALKISLTVFKVTQWTDVVKKARIDP